MVTFKRKARIVRKKSAQNNSNLISSKVYSTDDIKDDFKCLPSIFGSDGSKLESLQSLTSKDGDKNLSHVREYSAQILLSVFNNEVSFLVCNKNRKVISVLLTTLGAFNKRSD